MRLNKNNRVHRFIIFLIIAIPVSIAGFWLRSNAQEEEAMANKNEAVEESKHNIERPETKEVYGPDSYTYTEEEEEAAKEVEINEDVDSKNLEESKKVAETFAKEFGTYTHENPLKFLSNVENILGDELLKDWNESPPRRTGGLQTSNVIEMETYPVDGGNNDYVAWNVVAVLEQENNIKEKYKIEEWYWILLSNEEGQWKIEEVDVTNGG